MVVHYVGPVIEAAAASRLPNCQELLAVRIFFQKHLYGRRWVGDLVIELEFEVNGDELYSFGLGTFADNGLLCLDTDFWLFDWF